MQFVPAICTCCGAPLEVDSSRQTAICTHCGTTFLTDQAIRRYRVDLFIRQGDTSFTGDFKTLLSRAAEEYQIGDYETARALIDAALEHEPDSFPAQRLRFDIIAALFLHDSSWGKRLCHYGKTLSENSPSSIRRSVESEIHWLLLEHCERLIMECNALPDEEKRLLKRLPLSERASRKDSFNEEFLQQLLLHFEALIALMQIVAPSPLLQQPERAAIGRNIVKGWKRAIRQMKHRMKAAGFSDIREKTASIRELCDRFALRCKG